MKATGTTTRRSDHVPSQSEIDEMVRLYREGRSLEGVSQHLGLVARTVERHLKARGVERRDTHGRSR